MWRGRACQGAASASVAGDARFLVARYSRTRAEEPSAKRFAAVFLARCAVYSEPRKRRGPEKGAKMTKAKMTKHRTGSAKTTDYTWLIQDQDVITQSDLRVVRGLTI